MKIRLIGMLALSSLFIILTLRIIYSPVSVVNPSIVHSLLSSDVNGDGKVDFADLAAVVRQFTSGTAQPADVDQNQKVNSLDFTYVLKAFTSITPTPTNTGCTYPSQILNLTNWKETLPTGSSGSPTEIKQPALSTYSDLYFKVNSACNGVQFLAPVNGVTTSGSSYPRSELREMTSNGSANAAWSATSGTHTMVIDEAVIALPQTKPHIVVGQIHDAGNDISVFRLEGTNLYLTNGNTSHYKLITSSYQLGTRFQVKFVVSGGNISAYYNGVLQGTIPFTGSGLYFKAGAYIQSNCTTEASGLCLSSNFGETYIYNLQVTHQ